MKYLCLDYEKFIYPAYLMINVCDYKSMRDVDRIYLTQTWGRRNFFLKIGVFQGHHFNALLIGSFFSNRINGIILLHHCIHKKLDAIFHQSIVLKDVMNLRCNFIFHQWVRSQNTFVKRPSFSQKVVLKNASVSKKEIPMWLLFLLTKK